MSTKRKKNSASPLRAALAAKTSLRTFHEIPIVPQEKIETAKRNLDVARQMVAATLLHDDAEVREKADQALATAQAARDACFHRIEFRGLGLDDFDALVTEHPATPAQVADDDYDFPWDRSTFDYALLEHATVDSDLTAEEWKAELTDGERWPAPERARIINNCLAAQRQTMADAVPKD